jgi:L-threonylcarbamoyladenylate synthase
MPIVLATPQTIVDAAHFLKEGKLVAFPTETVYGLGADAHNTKAIRQIFEVKRRPSHHPLIVHVADIAQIEQWATDIPASAIDLLQHFSDAPLALILKRQPHVSDYVTGNQNTIALRIPHHPIALALLQTFNSGIAAPSANRFCRISPTQAHHVQEELGEDVDLILDGGPCDIGVESTILDLSCSQPTLLRFGHVTRSAIAQKLGTEVQLPPSLQAITTRTAGMMAVHYAPLTPAICYEANVLLQQLHKRIALGQKIGLLTCGMTLSPTKVHHLIELPAEPLLYAKQLYASLRALDHMAFDLILVEKPPQTEAWQAINDRLSKASHQGHDLPSD